MVYSFLQTSNEFSVIGSVCNKTGKNLSGGEGNWMSVTESQLPQLNPSTDAADFLPPEVNYQYDFLTIKLLTSKEIIYKRT